MTVFSFAISLVFAVMGTRADEPVRIGSKIFTESYILAEVAAQVVEGLGAGEVDRKLGMGSTGVLYESLRVGGIDVYPDYTGTIGETILKTPELRFPAAIRTALEPHGLTISDSLGFTDSYQLAVRRDFARQNGLHTISDLKKLGEVRAAFSYEFMDRQDGFEGLVGRYALSLPNAVRMEHSLLYRALVDRQVDVIEVYSTDANLKKFDLVVLADDLGYFPRYEAVWVARSAFVAEHPEAWRALRRLENKITLNQMQTMNARADVDREPVSTIAADFLHRKAARATGLGSEILSRTREHLRLIGFAFLFSIVAGIPLGVLATRSRALGNGILIASSVVQTIPALALLCFLIPLFGIGLPPALVALCMYSLLPVVLNTFTAVIQIDARHLENARAFGLTAAQRLLWIELPLASPAILAGVKTALIVSIGTATLAALVGAGGYGALIISGLSLNDTSTILAGAVPAAALALLVEVVFMALARLVIPKGLRKDQL